MTIAGEVKNRIEALQPNIIFSYRDLNMPTCYSEAVIKVLNRLAQDGRIEKYAKGKFYKPAVSVFGKLKPSGDEVVKDLLVKAGQKTGYITGYAIFNKLALTTQVPNVIQIGTRERKMKMKRGLYSIAYVVQRNEITDENIPLLQLLDVIRMIKDIPDTTPNQSCKRLINILKEQDEGKIERIVVLAENYSPGARALTGAMIEHVWGAKIVQHLYDSLNPLSSYPSYGIKEEVLPQMRKWRLR